MKSFFVQVKTEMKLHFREPEAIFWGFVFPVLLVVVLGFLFSKNQGEFTKEKIYFDKEIKKEALLYKTIESNKKIQIILLPRDSIVGKVKQGRLDVGVLLEKNDSTNFVRVLYHTVGKPTFDRVYPIIQVTVANLNYDIVKKKIPIPFQVVPKKFEITSEKGQQVTYVSWLVPGVIALNIFMSCIYGIGITVVQDKKQGKLKKIATTPLKKSTYILSIAFQRISILMSQAIVIILAGYLIFDISIKGSLLALFFALLISMFSFMVFGFFLASFSKTMEKAVAVANILFVVSLLTSGAYFPNTALPEVVKFVCDSLLITMSVDLVRGIYSYGHSILSYPNETIGLVVWLIVSLVLSSKMFQWYND